MKSGFVSFLGRPNAGKSTLLNRIVGQKLAIVSDKPQTTRTRVVGVKNYPDGQVVFVDTPGVHKPTHRMNVRMVDIALEAMREVDVLALVVDASVKPGQGDRYLLDAAEGREDAGDPGAQQGRSGRQAEAAAAHRSVPAGASVRRDRARVGGGRHQRRRARSAVPAAPAGRRAAVSAGLPDRSDASGSSSRKSSASRCCSSRTTSCRSRRRSSSTSSTKPSPGCVNLYCTILVERESQKPIVIGKGGAMIKQIGTAARSGSRSTSTSASTWICTSR